MSHATKKTLRASCLTPLFHATPCEPCMTTVSSPSRLRFLVTMLPAIEKMIIDRAIIRVSPVTLAWYLEPVVSKGVSFHRIYRIVSYRIVSFYRIFSDTITIAIKRYDISGNNDIISNTMWKPSHIDGINSHQCLSRNNLFTVATEKVGTLLKGNVPSSKPGLIKMLRA